MQFQKANTIEVLQFSLSNVLKSFFEGLMYSKHFQMCNRKRAADVVSCFAFFMMLLYFYVLYRFETKQKLLRRRKVKATVFLKYSHNVLLGLQCENSNIKRSSLCSHNVVKNETFWVDFDPLCQAFKNSIQTRLLYCVFRDF